MDKIEVKGNDWMGDPYSAIIRKVAYKPDAKPGGKVYAVLGYSSCNAMFEAEMIEGGWWFKERLI